MRTIVDLPEDQVRALDLIGKKNDVSRAELVRRAVGKYLEDEKAKSAGVLDRYFGVFKDDPTVFDGLSGLDYQRKIRAEWDERDAAVEHRLKSGPGFHDHSAQDYKE